MAHRWLGISILVLWFASAACAVFGHFDAAWLLSEVWTVLVFAWLLRAAFRALRFFIRCLAAAEDE
jgi:hypothetical protein